MSTESRPAPAAVAAALSALWASFMREKSGRDAYVMIEPAIENVVRLSLCSYASNGDRKVHDVATGATLEHAIISLRDLRAARLALLLENTQRRHSAELGELAALVGGLR